MPPEFDDSLPLHARQGGRFQFDIKEKTEKKDDNGRDRIRCPKCQWNPKPSDRWMCQCGHVWNTFETRGKCPGCGFQWTQTMCLQCHEWSEHEAWYDRQPSG